ncbi:MAG: hypothetical protein ACREMD_09980 [Gemmatimonadota bacterium]
MPAFLTACNRDRGGSATEETAAPPPPSVAAVNPDTIPPPSANGEPMPAAVTAAGIPPYPGATVWMLSRAPASAFRVQAFTPDPWDRVAAFYEESLPGWRMVRTKDAVVFQKEPDQAAIMISPWNYGVLPASAPEALREARTSIGTSWR